MSMSTAGAAGGMLGANGTKTISTTVWGGEGRGAARIDVENPKPGQRPEQIHCQEGNETYIYDTVKKVFRDAPKAVNRLLERPDVQKAIEKGMKILGEKT